MEIKNLAQLKRAINDKKEFVILEHFIHKGLTGQRRKPNKIQTNGFYSIVPDNPECKESTCNSGLGMWFEYGKASDWEFINGTCIRKDIWKIKFVS